MSRMTKVKSCPICKIGTPRLIHYSIPMKYNPDVWEETEDCLFKPILTSKKVECSNCGASTVTFEMSIEAAINEWNHEDANGKRSWIFQFVAEENLEVEND